MFSPKTGEKYVSGFEWDIQGGNLLDEKVADWMEKNREVTVTDVKMNPLADLKIILDNGYAFEIHVDTTSPEFECWRFFEYNGKHLVVEGDAVYFIGEDSE